MAIIRVNYQNVDRQVGRLRQIGEEHRRAADMLDTQRAALANAWQDPAGAAYCAAASSLVAEMRATADDITRLAHQIKDAAVRYRQQEEAGVQAARRLQS